MSDTDVVRVFYRLVVFVCTDCVTAGVALSRVSDCRCWGLDEDDVAALCHASRLVAVNPVRLAVHAVPTESTFPGLVLELRRMYFDVYEGPSSDRAEVIQLGRYAEQYREGGL